MGVVLEEEAVEGPIEGLRGIPPEVYARTSKNTRVASELKHIQLSCDEGRVISTGR